MPLFPFECNKCQNKWEELTKHDPTGKFKGICCPECGSKKKTKLLGVPHAVFTNPRDTSKWDNFSYRAGKTMEEAQDCRRNAEAKSHMGTDPYGGQAQMMADLNSDSNYGEVV